MCAALSERCWRTRPMTAGKHTKLCYNSDKGNILFTCFTRMQTQALISSLKIQLSSIESFVSTLFIFRFMLTLLTIVKNIFICIFRTHYVLFTMVNSVTSGKISKALIKSMWRAPSDVTSSSRTFWTAVMLLLFFICIKHLGHFISISQKCYYIMQLYCYISQWISHSTVKKIHKNLFNMVSGLRSVNRVKAPNCAKCQLCYH